MCNCVQSFEIEIVNKKAIKFLKFNFILGFGGCLLLDGGHRHVETLNFFSYFFNLTPDTTATSSTFLNLENLDIQESEI